MKWGIEVLFLISVDTYNKIYDGITSNWKGVRVILEKYILPTHFNRHVYCVVWYYKHIINN